MNTQRCERQVGYVLRILPAVGPTPVPVICSRTAVEGSAFCDAHQKPVAIQEFGRVTR